MCVINIKIRALVTLPLRKGINKLLSEYKNIYNGDSQFRVFQWVSRVQITIL